jgi:hypothetical protein
MKLFEYLPGTRTLYSIYMMISKYKHAINTLKTLDNENCNGWYKFAAVQQSYNNNINL